MLYVPRKQANERWKFFYGTVEFVLPESDMSVREVPFIGCKSSFPFAPAFVKPKMYICNIHVHVLGHFAAGQFLSILCLNSRAIFAGASKTCFMASQFETFIVIPGQFCKTLGLPWSVLKCYICTFRVHRNFQSTATFKPPITYTCTQINNKPIRSHVYCLDILQYQVISSNWPNKIMAPISYSLDWIWIW